MKGAVVLHNLTKTFGDFTAVNEISLEVGKGEIFGFLGPNGAGKSTTIKMLCGILTPSAGVGTVAGHDIVTEQDGIKNVIGYMSQRFSLYEDLTVRENLEFFGSVYGLGVGRLKEAIQKVVDMAGIDDGMEKSLVKKLPGGVKQRLALGAAILHDPEILFLDEPTSGVDPIMRRNFWEIIYRFSEEGKTVFVTTHYMDEAEHCGRIALIIAGNMIALGSPDELKAAFPYAVYSITVENFIETFERIRYLDFIIEAAIFGSDIHIICDRDVPATKLLNNYFVKEKRDRVAIRKVQPGLEDVFVSSARRYSR